MNAALNELGRELFDSFSLMSPVVWLCGVKLRREAEKACDDLVVFATDRSELYARSLINVAELTFSKTHLKRRIPIMNVVAATESDLALRIRRTLNGDGSRMTMLNRFLSVVLLLGMAALTLPSSGIAQPRRGGEARTETKDEVDWEEVRSTAPEDWSDELKAQIVAAGHDPEAIAERVRQGQRAARDKGDMSLEEIGRKIRAAVESGELTPEEGRAKYEAARQRAEAGNGDKAREERVWRAAMAQDPDDWSAELKAAILELKPDSTIEEIAEAVRQRQAHGAGEGTRGEGRERDGHRLREFQKGVIARAMAMDPDEWPEELQAAIVRAGWNLEEFSEGIRQRQAGTDEPIELPQTAVNFNTNIEESSWGEAKNKFSESR